MTKRDYIAVSTEIHGALLTAHRTGSGESYAAVSATVERIVDGLSDVFAADNPNFDAERFATACGVEAQS